MAAGLAGGRAAGLTLARHIVKTAQCEKASDLHGNQKDAQNTSKYLLVVVTM